MVIDCSGIKNDQDDRIATISPDEIDYDGTILG